jgi:hypothetical protein
MNSALRRISMCARPSRHLYRADSLASPEQGESRAVPADVF